MSQKDKRYLLRISEYDGSEKVQLLLLDEKDSKVLFQSLAVRKLTPDLIHLFSSVYGPELKISDKSPSQ